MYKRLFMVFLILGITLLMTSCGALTSVLPPNTEVPPTAMPPAPAAPPTAIPATAIPATKAPPPPTAVPPTEAPAAATNGLPAGCVDAVSITADKIGQTLCIGGIVTDAAGTKGDYFIYFAKKSQITTIYFFAPAWPTSGVTGAKVGDCVYIQNATVTKFGASGMIVPFGPKDLKHCS